ncbi:hypothetical protein [Ligilactobacillus salivarius]|uniref:hypothetical protein n=1 Tax=Ligilactobacillus salivarius TaxID=1624 RepID=UPI002966001B|nr:hypothetical protein [Ligilactobacillus salivarius]MDW3023105.1 hypothetical protein [Ligilactobacillus salivarius]
MEFVGYVVKIGNCYFRSKLNNDYMICESIEGAMKITAINYAKKIAEETGGVVKHLYVSDKKLDEYKEQ